MKGLESLEDSTHLDLNSNLEKLEAQFSDLNSRKASMEKLIQDYNHLFYTRLGKLISEINLLKLDILKKEAAENSSKEADYKNAKRENEEFENLLDEVSQDIASLSNEEQKKIKSNFRKASLFCHPDMVADEFQKKATQIFNELKEAYKSNNLKKVDDILNRLKNEIKFPRKSETVNDIDRLNILIDHLKNDIMKLENEIKLIKNSEIYIHITSIGNWEVYIDHLRIQFEKELNRLRSMQSAK